MIGCPNWAFFHHDFAIDKIELGNEQFRLKTFQSFFKTVYQGFAVNSDLSPINITVDSVKRRLGMVTDDTRYLRTVMLCFYKSQKLNILS